MTILRGPNGLRRAVTTRKDGWTVARRRTFLDELAMTCNVTGACRTVGKTKPGAYALKRRDPEFARLWNEAMDLGAERLEDELMAHTLGQVSLGENPTDTRPVGEPMPFDPKLAMEVLRLRAREAPTPRGRNRRLTCATPAEIDEALMKRLDQLAKRMRP